MGIYGSTGPHLFIIFFHFSYNVIIYECVFMVFHDFNHVLIHRCKEAIIKDTGELGGLLKFLQNEHGS